MPEQIQRQHVERALIYIVQREIQTDIGIYYLKRDGRNPHRCAPRGWAVPGEGAGVWVGMKETARVAYLYSREAPPDPDFSDKQLRRIDRFRPMWKREKGILENLGFLCEDRRP